MDETAPAAVCLSGCLSIQRFLIIVSYNPVYGIHGNKGILINFQNDCNYVPKLVGVDCHFQHGMGLVSKSAFAGNFCDPVPADVENGLTYVIRLVGNDFQFGQFEALVHGIDYLCRHELENDGVQRLIPSEHQTGKKKDVYRQLLANPKAEICGVKGGDWWRVSGELVPDDRVEAKRHMLDAYPALRKMYDENDDNTIVLYFKNATARFSSMVGRPAETVEF